MDQLTLNNSIFFILDYMDIKTKENFYKRCEAVSGTLSINSDVSPETGNVEKNYR